MRNKPSPFPALPKNELARVRQLTNVLRANKEEFRQSATDAFAQFSLKDRALSEALVTQDTNAYDVLDMWKNTLQPMRESLGAKSRETALQKALVKHLMLEEDAAAAHVSRLLSERQESMLETCIDELYPDPSSKNRRTGAPRQQARNMLALPDNTLEDFMQRFLTYHLYRHVAAMHQVTIRDPHAPWFKRVRSSIRIRKERKQTSKQEQRRLAQIEQRLKELDAANNNLPRQLAANSWELISIIALRNQYEKRVNALSESDAKSPTTRLKIFDAVTSTFRDQELEKLTRLHANSGLTSLRTLSEEIDTLLLHLFDLGNIQKNQLLLQMREYRLLKQEQDKLLRKAKV